MSWSLYKSNTQSRKYKRIQKKSTRLKFYDSKYPCILSRKGYIQRACNCSNIVFFFVKRSQILHVLFIDFEKSGDRVGASGERVASGAGAGGGYTFFYKKKDAKCLILI